ncbi:MAG TPA: GTP cyclohydrolase I FolE [Anaerolineaceae bacterium]
MHSTNPVRIVDTNQLPSAIALTVASPVEAVEPLVHDLLLALGEDPGREGLKRTPERVARMYQEILAGYQTDINSLLNEAIFETDYQDMVLVRDVKFYSLCEHHLLPFFGVAHVAYIPDGKIIGLSKIPRLVEMFARRLQVQERMTQQIAETLQEVLHPRGVAVVVEGAHMCAMMRGVRKSEARMVTSAMLGDFRANVSLRQDLFAQLQLHAAPAGTAEGLDLL